MKKIKEASHEYFRAAQLGFENPGSEAGFKAGVEFAQRWISVEDELPETIDDEKIFLRYPILIKNIDGSFQSLNTFSNIGTYTHWRPIELK